MLQGHVVRELLSPALRNSSWFTYHELFHGITAPGFLFGAGFAFAISSQRRWETAVQWGRPLLRRLWRLLMLIGIGYALHLPFLSLAKTFSTATPAQWREFYNFDALQCIALTLLFLRLVLVTVRIERRSLWIILLFLFAFVYATPFVWQPATRSVFPEYMVSALNGLNGSLFPLFPYAAYVFAGVIVSWVFLRSATQDDDDRRMMWFAVAGVALVAGGFLLDAVPVHVYPAYDFWNASPNYFWTKLGFLILLLSALWFFEETLPVMPRWLTTLGIESLFVYIFHLILLYGWVINAETNMSVWWGNSLGLAGSGIAAGVLIGICALAAYGWRFLKRRHPILMRGAYWWMGFCVVYSFLVNPY